MWSSRFDAAAIAQRLAVAARGKARRRELESGQAGPPRPAAVLLPLIRPSDDRLEKAAPSHDHQEEADRRDRSPWSPSWRLLFIRRAEHEHDRHSGEVAFPGGRADPGEPDAVATALREAQEEIGLDPNQVEILGQMPPFITVSGYRVTPVIGIIPWPIALKPEPTEVAEVFSLSLDWLREPTHRHTRLWPAPDHPQAREVIFYQEHEGRRLWGVTAWITLDFLRCLEPEAEFAASRPGSIPPGTAPA